MTGLKTFNSKLPCEPAKPMAASLPTTCTATIVIASDCVGFTLPGMIDEPGSFSGRMSSPSPLRGPDASTRMSFATFIRLPASVAIDPGDVAVELRDVAGELLTERERDGVLQVRAPDLHDVVEVLAAAVERVAE